MLRKLSANHTTVGRHIDGRSRKADGHPAAQPAHAADAAARPQDRGDFGIWVRSNGVPIYRCGAADGHTVSPPYVTHPPQTA